MAKNTPAEKSGSSAPKLGLGTSTDVSDPFVFTPGSDTLESSTEEYLLPMLTISQDGFIGNQLEYYECFGYPPTPEYFKVKLDALSPCPHDKESDQKVCNLYTRKHSLRVFYSLRYWRTSIKEGA